MNGTDGPHNDAKHGDVTDGLVLCTQPGKPNKFMVHYANTCSGFRRLVPTAVAHTGPKATDDIRVQLVNHRDGQRSYLVLDVTSGSVHNRADKFLSAFCEGTQRTYAYHLVDHLRWLAVNGYREDSITIQNLLRYLALCGTQHHGPLGTPWRASPLGESAQAVRAACLKDYYLDLTTREGVNAELRTALSTRRLPNVSDRNRSMLGHHTLYMAANPLSHATPPRKHPRMLPDGTREAMLDAVRTARDRMIVTWLSDSGMRIGELCGLWVLRSAPPEGPSVRRT